MRSSLHQVALGALLALAVLAPAAPAQAGGVSFGPHDVATVFFISKSDDHNRVDYGIRLDASCAPVSDDAMFLYWRVFEKAPPVRVQSLSMVDYIPYGISTQRTVKRTAAGGEYSMRLKQFDRAILITTTKEADGKCSAVARSAINGSKAQLVSVYAKLAGFMSVDYLDVFGKNLGTGAAITERIKK